MGLVSVLYWLLLDHLRQNRTELPNCVIIFLFYRTFVSLSNYASTPPHALPLFGISFR